VTASIESVESADRVSDSQHDADAHGSIGMRRIDALSDGVFAVALTLPTFDVAAANEWSRAEHWRRICASSGRRSCRSSSGS
jgi:hypothetical protein